MSQKASPEDEPCRLFTRCEAAALIAGATTAAAIIVACIVCLFSGCRCVGDDCGDPIVNPGTEGNKTSMDGYVPWWVRAGFGNGAGVVVTQPKGE